MRIQSTSVAADSSNRVVFVVGSISKTLVIGTTTAEDVPPKITPSIKLERKFKSKKLNEKKVTMTVVTIKLARVKKPEVLNELIRTLKFNEQPLSKSMTTKAIVVITSPIFPKSEGETILKTGPITIPKIIRINTSGIKVFLKTKLKA